MVMSGAPVACAATAVAMTTSAAASAAVGSVSGCKQVVNGQCPNEPMGHLECVCGIACETPKLALRVLPVGVVVEAVVVELLLVVWQG